MKLSTLYFIYPENRSLARRLTSAIGMLPEEAGTAAALDTSVAVADNFRFTRGNYEQNRYSTRNYEHLRDAFDAALSDSGDPSECVTRESDPASWAELQCILGNLYAALGQQRWDASSFERAIQCFSNALEVYSQEQTPAEWAAAQYDLGTANQALGRLQNETKPMKAAVDAYTNALLVWSRESSPEEWMTTMYQLGATFHTYGLQLTGNRLLQKSVVAYKNALSALDADNYALELTAAHNNRAAVLHHLGESEDNHDRLKEAIRSYEKALTVGMEQQLPIHVAVLCRVNKATAQNVLAQMTNDADLAGEVADEFEVVLECFPHALQPLCLKHCREQMEIAQSLLKVTDNEAA